MQSVMNSITALFLVPILLFFNSSVIWAAQAGSQPTEIATEILHVPVETLNTGVRKNLSVEVADPSGVALVRVYFKAVEAENYSFIKLAPFKESQKSALESFKRLGTDFSGIVYKGTLPAAKTGSNGFEYLILVKTNSDVVVKSQHYFVAVTEAEEKAATAVKPLKVFTELETAPTEITGFSDNLTIDVVESASRYEGVAGLNSQQENGGGAVNGGSIVASAGGFSTTAIAVGSAALLGAVVLGAAAGGGGGSGGGGGGQALNAETLVGTWHGPGHYPNCSSANGTFTFNGNGTWSASETLTCYGESGSRSGSGSWSLNGTSLNMSQSRGPGAVAQVSGNSNSFRLSFSSGVYYNLSR